MDVLYQSCAGIDVHQATVVVCILHGSLTSTRPKREMAQFDTTTKGLKACHDFHVHLPFPQNLPHLLHSQGRIKHSFPARTTPSPI